MKHFIYCFFIFIAGCKSIDKSPLIPKDTSSESEKKNTLFVFVGEKIAVTESAQDSNSMDAQFNAKYKILQRIYGEYPNDSIEFAVYDHYGVPGFSHYDNAMLFVSKYKGKYYHEKYQFFDVYPTTDGKWAGIYHDFPGNFDATPKNKIAFQQNVLLPLTIINNDGDTEQLKYSAPFYKIVDGKAFPLYGYSIEELFEIKKEGVLKGRGLFGNGNEHWEDSIVDTEMAEIGYDSTNDKQP